MKQIAIDGPAGAGKSTIARRLAAKLGYVYVDTGAMYRAITLALLRAGVDTAQAQAVAQQLPGVCLSLEETGGEQRVLLDGADVTRDIRTPQVSMATSAVSAIPAVRAFLLEQQRALAASHNVVMDGRDIGTVVLPQAGVKIFLTASPEDRARRRYEEMLEKGQRAVYEEVLADIRQRDYQDSHRAVAPLKPAPDAILVDTTGNTLEQSVAQLEKTVLRALAQS